LALPPAEEATLDPPEPTPGHTRRWRLRRIIHLLMPGVIFLGLREFGVLVLSLMADANGEETTENLRSWDGNWFLSIAEHGYNGVPDNMVDAFGKHSFETPLAFFPGYPTMVGWLHDIGFRLVPSALALTIVSGIATAYGLTRLGTLITGGSRRTGLILVALFAASPMAIVLSMAYSEAMFCAYAVWALVFVLERNWITAGLCCATAGLVRSTAAALILAVCLAALVAIIRRRESWRPWLGALLAPLGLLGYLAFVAVQTGEWDGWFALQRRGWDSQFDGGEATFQFTIDALTKARNVLEIVTVAMLFGALALLVIGWRKRVEWPLLVYAAGVLVMDLCSNGMMSSKARLMVPAFTLVIPIAIGLAKRRTSTVLLTLSAITVASAWFGAYTLTSWPYAI
jgi:hypothetical protein